MRSNQQFYDMAMPMPSRMYESFSPFHQFPFYQQISTYKPDSTLTFHIHDSRKRLRDSTTESNTLQPQPQHKFQLPNQSNFLDQSILHLCNSQQSEINSLIAQHTENLRTEIQKLTMKQARMLQCMIHDSMVKKLKQKDEAIEDLGKVQLMLQERVKTLIMENQIWREMAMTNENAVNSLRIELEKVMQVSENHQQHNGCDDAEEAESSCRSNCHVEVEKKVAGKWMCKQCGVNRSELLLLPCRHLCLCTVCGSGILNCPLCFSAVNASVQVNFC